MITEKEPFKEEKAGVNKNNEKASIISIHDKKKIKIVIQKMKLAKIHLSNKKNF